METNAPTYQKPGLIFEKISAVMADLEAISKDSKNDAQKYKFRGIDAVYNELHKHLCKHKVFTTTEVIEHRREEKTQRSGSISLYSILTIRFRFYASDGSFVESVVIGEGMDSGDKASNKAMAVAHKYAFLQIFAIPTEDDKDPENDAHDVVPAPMKKEPAKKAEKIADSASDEPPHDYTAPPELDTPNVINPISPAQVTLLWTVATACGWNSEHVHASLSEAGIKSVREIPLARFQGFINWMERNKR